MTGQFFDTATQGPARRKCEAVSDDELAGWSIDFSDDAPVSAEQARLAIQAIGLAVRALSGTAEGDQFDAWTRDTFGSDHVAGSGGAAG